MNVYCLYFILTWDSSSLFVSLHGQEAGLLTNTGNQRPSPSDKVYLFPSDTCQLGQATPTTTSPLG